MYSNPEKSIDRFDPRIVVLNPINTEYLNAFNDRKYEIANKLYAIVQYIEYDKKHSNNQFFNIAKHLNDLGDLRFIPTITEKLEQAIRSIDHLYKSEEQNEIYQRLKLIVNDAIAAQRKRGNEAIRYYGDLHGHYSAIAELRKTTNPEQIYSGHAQKIEDLDRLHGLYRYLAKEKIEHSHVKAIQYKEKMRDEWCFNIKTSQILTDEFKEEILGYNLEPSPDDSIDKLVDDIWQKITSLHKKREYDIYYQTYYSNQLLSLQTGSNIPHDVFQYIDRDLIERMQSAYVKIRDGILNIPKQSINKQHDQVKVKALSEHDVQDDSLNAIIQECCKRIVERYDTLALLFTKGGLTKENIQNPLIACTYAYDKLNQSYSITKEGLIIYHKADGRQKYGVDNGFSMSNTQEFESLDRIITNYIILLQDYDNNPIAQNKLHTLKGLKESLPKKTGPINKSCDEICDEIQQALKTVIEFFHTDPPLLSEQSLKEQLRRTLNVLKPSGVTTVDPEADLSFYEYIQLVMYKARHLIF